MKFLANDPTWINPENIMPSEISHIEKDKYCMISLYEVPRIIKFRDRKKEYVTRGWERGIGVPLFNE